MDVRRRILRHEALLLKLFELSKTHGEMLAKQYEMIDLLQKEIERAKAKQK